ncbi:MAG: AAA family ATPase [Terrisporobacter sp.]|uniref:AAA family ATPase n=2 Tax=Terrisporobacter sp. TaxID=1965305 RepID=UPI002A918F82|nr:AAA family ATPase [Terrisporobacter sp.]MDY6153261.1 AAA family ATPase [Terrisporobacter sp.]
MTLEEVKQKLKVFDKYKFFENGHYYTYKDKKVGVSVTKYISQFENEFDSNTLSQKVADKNGISQFEVLNEWKRKGEYSCLKGTAIHEWLQDNYANREYKFDLSQLEEYPEYYKIEDIEHLKKMAIDFINDYKNRYILIGDEILCGIPDFDIASAIDLLFYDTVNNEVVLADIKTNTDLKGWKSTPSYVKKMLQPLENIKDITFEHYKIQLSIYRYFLEEYAHIPISDNMFIVYLSEKEESYNIIQIPYLKNEVEKILKLRRANKMAKMILVMGEPASGKTVSLRNIPKNELYYIDCDKKGLNYKGWKNDFNEENKNYFKTNDGELIAKCMQGISEKREDIHYIVIDTINSIMIADEMRRSKDKNFDKWIDLASCIFNLVNIVPDLRDDITVIFIGHTQTDDEGFTRLLTNGKKLNKIGLEKYFDTVLIAKNNDGKYVFETKSPNSTARTPMGSYDDEQYIDNDLYEVIKVLKEY